jgi:hypothetical protein
VAIPSDRNVINEESEKKLKYKNLSIEIQRMWNMKCFVIPVIIGATGIVTRGLKKYLETIPGKHTIDSLQKKKTAVLGTSHTIRKCYNQKLESRVVGFTIGSRGKVPGQTCEKKRRSNNSIQFIYLRA